MSLKQEIVEVLDKIADLLEFKEENPFKVNAFRKGAITIKALDDFEQKITDGSIKDIKGIGKGLLSVIYDYYDNGKSNDLENLIKEIPEGLIDLLSIRGLGIKKTKMIYQQLGISNIDDLEKACIENKISNIKGFGLKLQQTILKDIERITSANKYLLLNEAEQQVESIYNQLNIKDIVSRFEVTGEYRRAMEIISQIEFVALVKGQEKFIKILEENNLVWKTIPIENKLLKNSTSYVSKIEINDLSIIPIYLYMTDNESEFDKILFIKTGSDDFVEALFKDEKIKSNNNDIFAGREYESIIPEMREKQYFSLSDEKRNNSDLALDKFQGFFHFHTNYSDGKNTLTEMSKSMIDKGYNYLAVCDHSKSAFYANGLTEERVLQQRKEINKTSKEYNVEIFHGIESDILKEGELDYDNEFLKNFDFVVASIHSRFQMEEAEMTKRIIKAIENPNTDVLGHPTGRLLLKRDGYKVDIKKIIDACSENRVAIEINANPHRLDLDWRNIYYAREKGCLFSINPDAHSVEDIDFIKYGIMIARKGGITSEEVINCFSKEKFISFINRKVKRSH